MQSTEPVIEAVPAKKQTPLILAVSAIVLCCCCAVAAAAGYYGYITLQAPQTEFQPDDDATPESFEPESGPTDAFEVPDDDFGLGDPPTGGLGNEILRADTWQYVAFAAMGQGCERPVAEDTAIEVLQEPQNGVWVEKWTVACASGESYAYEVEFLLDDTGTSVNIKLLP